MASRYRIFAFDHDLFSFADVTFDKWPVVLITNPKSLLYSCAKHEPLERLFHSTHIRYVSVVQNLLYLVPYNLYLFIHIY